MTILCHFSSAEDVISSLRRILQASIGYFTRTCSDENVTMYAAGLESVYSPSLAGHCGILWVSISLFARWGRLTIKGVLQVFCMYTPKPRPLQLGSFFTSIFVSALRLCHFERIYSWLGSQCKLFVRYSHGRTLCVTLPAAFIYFIFSLGFTPYPGIFHLCVGG